MAHTSFGYSMGYGRGAKVKTYPTAIEAEKYAKRYAKSVNGRTVQLFAYPGAVHIATVMENGQVDLTWDGCAYL